MGGAFMIAIHDTRGHTALDNLQGMNWWSSTITRFT